MSSEITRYNSIGNKEYNISNGLPAVISLNITENVRPRGMKTFGEFHVSMAIVTYVFPIVIAIGTVGNILSFIVLTRRRLRDTSVYVYLAVLACADNGVLYLSAFKTWVRAVFQWELLHVSDAGCKIIMCLFLVSLHLSAWLIVAMSTDRFLVVWFPFKAAYWCSGKRAKITTAILTLIIIAYNIHVFWTLGLVRHSKTGRVLACGPSVDDYFMMKVFPILKLVSYSILPFCIVLVLNVLITFRLWKNRSSISRADGSNSSSRVSQNRITIMLLTVSFVWLLMTSPFTMWSLLGTHRGSSHQRAQTFLFKTICFLCLYINHGINFYLYCCTGRRFRQDLTDIICVPCRKIGLLKRPPHDTSMITMTTKTPLVRKESPWDKQASIGGSVKGNVPTYV